jgi:ketosteroid isomerase-like protein
MAGPQSAEGCDNPCHSVPYKPLSTEAQEIISSFMAGEQAVFDDDAEEASRILGDDLLFVTPDGAQPMDKAQRLAAIRKLRNDGRGELPPAVASIAVWVYGNAAIMSADQKSRFGDVLHATRVWAKRDGRWQLSFSQQTLVQ